MREPKYYLAWFKITPRKNREPPGCDSSSHSRWHPERRFESSDALQAAGGARSDPKSTRKKIVRLFKCEGREVLTAGRVRGANWSQKSMETGPPVEPEAFVDPLMKGDEKHHSISSPAMKRIVLLVWFPLEYKPVFLKAAVILVVSHRSWTVKVK